MQFTFYRFSDLSTTQLYALLALRSKVFIVDQKCAYLDPDGKDLFGLHLLGTENDTLLAYLRLFLPNKTQSELIFGRVVNDPSARGKGYGKQLIQEMLRYCDANFPGVAIKCSAQFYLQKFYEGFDFKACSEVYDEDGIPHIKMIRARN